MLPWPWQLKGKTGLFLLFPLWQGGVSASVTSQVFLRIPPLVLYRYGQPWGEGCSYPLQTHLMSLTPHTSSLDHLGYWYNTTNPIKDDDIALGEQSSQALGKGCMENRNTGMRHSPTSGLTLPNNCYLCEGGRSATTWCRADMLPCLPDTLLSLQGPSLLSTAPVLPQQGATLPCLL